MNDTEKSTADITVDLLVVGSGGGALMAALTAAVAGRKVLVIEKLSVLGGSTAYSGGAIWIPNNAPMREAGLGDTEDDAWKYFDALIGDVGAATSPARKKTYLDVGPRMVDFLRAQGLEFKPCRQYPDYYAGRPGGRSGGRSIESPVFDGKKLGADLRRLNRRTLLPFVPVRAADLAGASNGLRNAKAIRTTLGIVWRTISAKLLGRTPLSMGMALVGQLLLALQKHGVELRTSTPLQRLLTDGDGKVIGAVANAMGTELLIHARDGVMLACGGFAHNAAMRTTHQPLASPQWSSSSPGDEGDGIRAGVAVGAATAQMEESWWMPTSVLPDGTPSMCGVERCKPYSFIVDARGERFMNEATSYMEIGQKIQRRHAEHDGAIPCWLILDARHRRFYPFGTWLPGRTPQAALDTGYIVRAATLDEIATRCGIDAAGLARTVERYNRMCASGIDADFRRGDDPFDRYYGDARVKPNPTMGPIEQGPFYAIALFPGDIGTCGGLLTDEHARVLQPDGKPIAGLYATGNCTASVMGHIYPGAGATIGPSMVFGYVGARHSSGHRNTDTAAGLNHDGMV